MLFDALWAIAKTLLTPLTSIFPTWSLFSTIGLDVPAASGAVGRHMAIVNGIVPLGEPMRWAALTYMVLLPLFAAYHLASWVWRHIPDVFGFGPGAG
jgi:hypothetical protein